MRSAVAGSTPCASSPVLIVCGSVDASPMIISVKKIPIESTWAEFWNVWFIAPPAPRCSGGRLFMTAARLGDANMPIASPAARGSREQRVGEVGRQQHQRAERERRAEHPAVRTSARRSGRESSPTPGRREHPDRQREHVDAGPQRRLGERVAVLGQPDALQPDDQHEHQTAARDRGQERRQRAERERADAEQRQLGTSGSRPAARRRRTRRGRRPRRPAARARAGSPSRWLPTDGRMP